MPNNKQPMLSFFMVFSLYYTTTGKRWIFQATTEHTYLSSFIRFVSLLN